MMVYSEVVGDLFKVPKDYVLAHCISRDCEMGAGIAKEFNRRYPRMKNCLLSTRPSKTAVVFYHQRDKHEVLNMVTKERYFHKPTRNDFNKTVISLKNEVVARGIKKLAIPLIGSGLDKLNWNVSSEFIKQTFKGTNIEILVVIKKT